MQRCIGKHGCWPSAGHGAGVMSTEPATRGLLIISEAAHLPWLAWSVYTPARGKYSIINPSELWWVAMQALCANGTGHYRGFALPAWASVGFVVSGVCISWTGWYPHSLRWLSQKGSVQQLC
jgi:hypothetical protein